MDNQNDNDPTANRFALLEFDDMPTTKIARSEPVTPAVSTFDQPVQDAEGAKRAEDDQHAVKAFVGTEDIGQQLFSNGTVLMQAGQETRTARALAQQALPSVGEAMTALKTEILMEQRADFNQELREVFITKHGDINNPGDSNLAPTEHSWRQLQSAAPKGTAVPSNVNSWLPLSHKSMVFRTRYPQSFTRECFAVVSQRYREFDLDKVTDTVMALSPAGSKADYKYDAKSTSWMINISVGNPALIKEGTVGEAHRMGIRLTGSDDGRNAIKIHHFAERLRCLNASLVTAESLVSRQTHKSSNLASLVRNAFSQSAEALAVHTQAWSAANEQCIHDQYDGTPLSAMETFKRLIAHGYVKLPGKSPEAILETLTDAWNAEPGHTQAHVNSAITRAAHDGGYSWQQQTELEEQAGELLYNRVVELPRMTDRQADMF